MPFLKAHGTDQQPTPAQQLSLVILLRQLPLVNPPGYPAWPQPHLLGIGLLHQGTPELIFGVGVAVNELVVDSGQPVIDDHVHPLPKAPEVEMEDAGIAVRLLRVPFLLLPVWDDLDGENGGIERHLAPEERGGTCGQRNRTRVLEFILSLHGLWDLVNTLVLGLGFHVCQSQRLCQVLSSQCGEIPQAPLPASLPHVCPIHPSRPGKPWEILLSPSPPTQLFLTPAFSPHHLWFQDSVTALTPTVTLVLTQWKPTK